MKKIFKHLSIEALKHLSIEALNRVTINSFFCLKGELVEIFDVQVFTSFIQTFKT